MRRKTEEKRKKQREAGKTNKKEKSEEKRVRREETRAQLSAWLTRITRSFSFRFRVVRFPS